MIILIITLAHTGTSHTIKLYGHSAETCELAETIKNDQIARGHEVKEQGEEE